jgi:hypothetical protein
MCVKARLQSGLSPSMRKSASSLGAAPWSGARDKTTAARKKEIAFTTTVRAIASGRSSVITAGAINSGKVHQKP